MLLVFTLLFCFLLLPQGRGISIQTACSPLSSNELHQLISYLRIANSAGFPQSISQHEDQQA
jgi:hypothetical protein